MKPEETMPAASSDPALELEPVNMYILFARLFADIAREVESPAAKRGSRLFGRAYASLARSAARISLAGPV